MYDCKPNGLRVMAMNIHNKPISAYPQIRHELMVGDFECPLQIACSRKMVQIPVDI